MGIESASQLRCEIDGPGDKVRLITQPGAGTLGTRASGRWRSHLRFGTLCNLTNCVSWSRYCGSSGVSVSSMEESRQPGFLIVFSADSGVYGFWWY
jgi:hypothetical protein